MGSGQERTARQGHECLASGGTSRSRPRELDCIVCFRLWICCRKRHGLMVKLGDDVVKRAEVFGCNIFMTTPIQAWIGRLGSGMAVLGILLCNGCRSTSRETQERADKRLAAERAKSAEAFKQSIVGRQRQISVQELDQLTYGYADRYYMVISSAADAIKRGNPDPIQRRMAHQIKLNGVLSMNDIVSGNDPYSQIFDLVVSVTLQSIVFIDENGG